MRVRSVRAFLRAATDNRFDSQPRRDGFWDSGRQMGIGLGCIQTGRPARRSCRRSKCPPSPWSRASLTLYASCAFLCNLDPTGEFASVVDAMRTAGIWVFPFRSLSCVGSIGTDMRSPILSVAVAIVFLFGHCRLPHPLWVSYLLSSEAPPYRPQRFRPCRSGGARPGCVCA